MKENKTFLSCVYKAFKSFGQFLPILLGIVFLMGLFKVYFSKRLISSIFTGNLIKDTFLGALIGSISTGNPITSYIIAGELQRQGISFFAITSFIVAWVTVGVIQLPAEASFLGKKFAIIRNGLSFIFSILVSIATVLTLLLIR